MDTRVDVVVVGGASRARLLPQVHALFEEQEVIFSRFRPDSLLSRLNRGEAVESVRFSRACRLAVEAFEAMGGLFNPMVLPALRAAGYRDSTGSGEALGPAPSPRDCLDILRDEVRLLQGQLDLGGIVKGWTVDLAAGLLESAPAALVNAGGDLRCHGHEPGVEGGWGLDVEVERARKERRVLRGGVATSSTLLRRWEDASGRRAHHLIDPRTGLPAESGLSQVTVSGPETWLAEVLAKATLIGGRDALALPERHGYMVLAAL
jgi:thiamine biosynthesis lipoprotein